MTLQGHIMQTCVTPAAGDLIIYILQAWTYDMPAQADITDRIKYRKAIMVFKSIINLAPRYMSDMFKKISETHCRVTRASNRKDLYLPGGKYKVLYTDSFAYSGVIIWNNLSPRICNCSNCNQFKSTYLNDYFS